MPVQAYKSAQFIEDNSTDDEVEMVPSEDEENSTRRAVKPAEVEMGGPDSDAAATTSKASALNKRRQTQAKPNGEGKFIP